MPLTLSEIAARFDLPLSGDGTLAIHGLCGLSDDLPGHLSFVRDGRQLAAASASRVPAFVSPPDSPVPGKANLAHPNPDYAMARIAALFQAPMLTQPVARHPQACIGASATLAADVVIGAFCTIGERCRIGAGTRIMPGCTIHDDVQIGAGCLIHAHCVLREGVRLGDRVVLQPGVVLGGDGFGYAQEGGRHLKIPQLGTVVVEDDVEIGANTAIDRARFGATRIGRGTKIDNLVMIAHNVQVGEDCLLVAQCGISGSTRLGNRVTLAGQVGIVGHVSLGDEVTVLGQSMVTKDLPERGSYGGSPAHPADLWHRAMAALYRAARRSRSGGARS